MAIHSEAILIIGVLIWLLLRTIIIYLNKRKGFGVSLKREALLFIFYVYLLCVLSITQFPIYIIKDHHIRLSVNLIPVVGTIKDIAQTTANSPYMIRIWIRNIVGNAILLLPMGILLPLLWTKFRKVGRVTLFAFLFSLGIETLQLLFTLLGNKAEPLMSMTFCSTPWEHLLVCHFIVSVIE